LSDLDCGSGRQPIVGVADGPIARLAALIQVNADGRVVVMRPARRHCHTLQPSRSQFPLLLRCGWILAVENATGVNADFPIRVDKVGRTISMAGIA